MTVWVKVSSQHPSPPLGCYVFRMKSSAWHKKLPRLAPFPGIMKFATQISPLLGYLYYIYYKNHYNKVLHTLNFFLFTTAKKIVTFNFEKKLFLKLLAGRASTKQFENIHKSAKHSAINDLCKIRHHRWYIRTDKKGIKWNIYRGLLLESLVISEQNKYLFILS